MNAGALPGQQEALRRYENLALRRDPEMVALVPLREPVVRKALLIRVDEVPRERYFTASG